MMRFEEYFQPTTVKECAEILKKYGKDAKILAGGTDIVPRLKMGVWQPKAVIGIQDIPNMNEMTVSKNGLHLGAATTLREISLAKKLDEDYEVIKEAAGHVSSMQVRNIATIGGNACNASPSADAIEGLMVMDAICEIDGVNGERSVPIAEFFVGPGKTVLEDGEMLVAFNVPKPAENTGAVYKKYAIRGDTDISIVGVGVRVTLDKGQKVEEARISLAAVAATPIRDKKAEAFLIGKKLTAEVIEEAAQMASGNCKPIDDQRASKEYRKEMIYVWTKHALEEANVRATK